MLWTDQSSDFGAMFRAEMRSHMTSSWWPAQKLIEQRAGGKGGAAVVARVHTWGHHAEMFCIVRELLG